MMQALKKEEIEDSIDPEDEDDFSPDYLSFRKPSIPSRPRATSGPGKRGRPRKHPISDVASNFFTLKNGVLEKSLPQITVKTGANNQTNDETTFFQVIIFI